MSACLETLSYYSTDIFSIAFPGPQVVARFRTTSTFLLSDFTCASKYFIGNKGGGASSLFLNVLASLLVCLFKVLSRKVTSILQKHFPCVGATNVHDGTAWTDRHREESWSYRNPVVCCVERCIVAVDRISIPILQGYFIASVQVARSGIKCHSLAIWPLEWERGREERGLWGKREGRIKDLNMCALF